MYDVITFGAATRDVFLRSSALKIHPASDVSSHVEACFPFGAKINVDEIVFETGGGATNAAVTFRRMAKLKTAVVTRAGDDSAARDIADAMKHDKVDTRFMQFARGERSGYSTILLSGAAERTILTYRGASASIDHDHIAWNKLHARAFYVTSLAGDLELFKKILAHAKSIGAKVYANPGGGELKLGLQKLRPFFAKLEFLSLNRDEAALLTGIPITNTGALIAKLRELSKTAILTDGLDGAYAISQEETLFAPVLPIKRINFTGAGDGFGSAFASALMRGEDLAAGLAYGTLNATSIVQHMGAKVGILSKLPTEQEINKVKVKKVSF